MNRKHLGPLALFALLISSAAIAAETWKPASPRLMTAWGEKVTPDSAWKEYPRPQFVRDRWINLNGLWDYAIAPKTAPQPAKFDGKILVPFAVESVLSGVGKPFTPQDRLWYRRAFAVPKDWADNRVLLHFGAVDYECVLARDLGLSAAVYTQTTDVEGEVNGFMTYDRKKIKIAPETLREINRQLTTTR